MRILNLLTTLTLSLAVLLLLAWAVALPTTAASGTRYVARGGECHGPAPCYATLQAAIDAAAPGDELRVAQGVYTDVTVREYNLTYPQTVTQVMFIDKSLTVRGGYTTTDWETAQPITYPTVIDPQGSGRGGLITIPDWDTSITVTLEGLSITNGYAEGSGGGLYVYVTSISISGCHVYSNTGGSLGSGLYLGGDKVTLTNNVIVHNTGGDYGYGVVIQGFPTLSGNYIMHNSSGLFLWNNRATLVNNVIAGNEHKGLSVSGGEVRAWHTTIADNGADGVSVTNSGQGAGHLVMTNTIIAGSAVGVRVVGNVPDPSIVQLVATLWDNVTDTYIVEGGQISSSRDFHAEPAFVGNGDYHLTIASPARNRGWPSDVRQDIDGEPRDPLPDLGADEFFDPDSIRQVYLPLVMR